MNAKRVIIYALIAAAVGIVAGGLSRMWGNDDGGFYVLAIAGPVVIFFALCGGYLLTRKKPADDEVDGEAGQNDAESLDDRPGTP